MIRNPRTKKERKKRAALAQELEISEHHLMDQADLAATEKFLAAMNRHTQHLHHRFHVRLSGVIILPQEEPMLPKRSRRGPSQLCGSFLAVLGYEI